MIFFLLLPLSCSTRWLQKPQKLIFSCTGSLCSSTYDLLNLQWMPRKVFTTKFRSSDSHLHDNMITFLAVNNQLAFVTFCSILRSYECNLLHFSENQHFLPVLRKKAPSKQWVRLMTVVFVKTTDSLNCSDSLNDCSKKMVIKSV